MNKKLVKQIKEQVKAQVSTVFAEEDLNSQKRVLEELLQNSATDMAELTEQLAAKEVELTEFQSQLDEQAERMKELEDRIDTMKTSTDESAAKVTEITEERDSLKAELHKLNQQIALENRVKELDSAGVLRSGEAADKQRVFIMKLSDEEFADYKEHLVETKAEIEAAVKATADPKPTEPSF